VANFSENVAVLSFSYDQIVSITNRIETSKLGIGHMNSFKWRKSYPR